MTQIKMLRALTLFFPIFLGGCGERSAQIPGAEGVWHLGSFDAIFEASKDGVKEVRFCGAMGSCERSNQFDCQIIRDAQVMQRVANVAQLMRGQAMPKARFLVTLVAFQRSFRDRCELKLNNINGIRFYGNSPE